MELRHRRRAFVNGALGLRRPASIALLIQRASAPTFRLDPRLAFYLAYRSGYGDHSQRIGTYRALCPLGRDFYQLLP